MVKMTFALKEYFLFLLCATVVIAATLAHMGLFSDNLNLNSILNIQAD